MNDDILRFTFSISPTKPGTEILIAELSQLNFDVFEETNSGVNAYIKKTLFDDTELKKVKIFNSNEFQIKYEIESIKNVNWNKKWEQNYKPVLIYPNCIIRAPFHKKTEFEYEIVIKPEMSFGTGHHETTRLIIEYLLEMNLNNKSICDVGCGTGILSILCDKKGAKSVDAIDINRNAFQSSKENIKINKCQNINLSNTPPESLIGNYYDLIISNITLNTLMNNFKNFSLISKKQSKILLSGFYESDVEMVANRLMLYDYNLVNYKTKNKWVSTLFQKY